MANNAGFNLPISYVRGTPLRAEHFTQPARILRDLLPSPVPATKDQRGVVSVRPFKIVQLNTTNGDFLYGQLVDYAGDHPQAFDVAIARPYLLRQTPFDGLTRDGITYTYTSKILRTADDGNDSITEQIIPKYVNDDIIYGIRAVGSGVDVRDDSEEVLYWLDLNVDGRAWAKVAV